LILARMAEPFILAGNEVHVSASVGITLYPDDGVRVDTILKNADQAMYAAKAQGRNCFHYFAPFMQEASQARKCLSDDLRDALGRGQFRVLYQTIVDLRSRRVHKAEALVRWEHPVHGLLNPADFIAIAETNGTIVDLGDWVFREAAQLVKRLQGGTSAKLQVCVNKSSFQFRDDGSHYREWLAYLEELGVDGDAIIVEVTEPMLQDAGKLVTDKLLAFRDAGMQVSLDDFGTGHCSLAFLKRYDIDYLKINPAFIANLAAGSFEANLCEAIIVMAHKLDMKVIAEGVETEQQLAILIQAGCDFGQGFLFSRPVDAAELEKILQTRFAACG
jgi:EAL domain-containing protein (putative c-di-GMP-specific phosphodiesterase class I)